MKDLSARGAGTQDTGRVGAFVWVPGWGMPPAVWMPVWPHLAHAAVHVVVDWAGCRAPGDFSHVVRTAVAQAREASRGPVAVVAWSLGSLVTLSIAREMADDVVALVLVGATARFVTAPDWPHGWDARVLRRFARRFARNSLATWRGFVASLFGPGERVEAAAVCQRLFTSPPPAEEGLAGLTVLAEGDAREELARCRVPVRLLHGSTDSVCPLSGARDLADALPNAHLTVWNGAGHAPHLVRPSAFARWLETELATVQRSADTGHGYGGAGRAQRVDVPS